MAGRQSRHELNCCGRLVSTDLAAFLTVAGLCRSTFRSAWQTTIYSLWRCRALIEAGRESTSPLMPANALRAGVMALPRWRRAVAYLALVQVWELVRSPEV